MPDEYEQISKHKTVVLVEEDGRSRVVYHGTVVVAFDDDEIVLDTGGWWTRSTKVRMNQVSRQFELGYEVNRIGPSWTIKFADETFPYESERMRLTRKSGLVTPLH